MIILPDRNTPRTQLLLPVMDKEWRSPSHFVPKDQMGNDVVQTRFRIDAKSNDGVVIWSGWFDERADFDAFLWAIVVGAIKQERALWDLPTPNWQPYLGELISYEFATVTFLTTAGSTQSYTIPSDWSNTNSFEAIGGGGGGCSGFYPNGGGGGGYSKISNQSGLSGSQTYFVGAGGAGGAAGASNAGSNGSDSYFINTSTLLAKQGLGGVQTSGGGSGSTGGQSTAGVGSTKYSGGKGGVYATGDYAGGGGGGAAGPSGAGNNGVNGPTAAYNGANGGSGGAGSGGAAGTGSPNSSTVGGNGGNGTEFDATHGSGGGGGGGYGSPGAGTAGGNGGNYGGGGGAGGYNNNKGGNGIQGIIVVTYTPALRVSGFNSPMLGM